MPALHTDPLIQELVDSYADWFLPGRWPYSGEMTRNLWPYTHLFTPIQVNSVFIKNRIVMAPMGNITMCDESGRPNEQMVDYLVERAKGGSGADHHWPHPLHLRRRPLSYRTRKPHLLSPHR